MPAAVFGADGGLFAAIGELTLAEVGEDVAAGFLEDAELFEPIVLALGDEGDAVLDGVLGDAGNVVVRLAAIPGAGADFPVWSESHCFQVVGIWGALRGTPFKRLDFVAEFVFSQLRKAAVKERMAAGR